ncbi:hypothetical protein C9374_004905 [Naegleria lovaniensis]|uniref:Clathrin heavy chain n=1 Tax=Naegleria lovaniensis TaxID=51637 RepID=A0AA88KKF5_NAELO|nr:uncharacterized protein C9374_004905 [Naegleria lovaniensis]KAG2382938.1 hypothetical protein C9374_004905 [Naegleria lovaniensis]
MSGQIPIQFTELFNLQNLGVNPQLISFTTVTLESDKYVCVRDQISPQKSIQIVDVDSQSVTSNKVNADSAIMHPTTKVLALRSGNTIQIFNLEMKAKMKEHTMTEAIVFWRWISTNTIAIVTATSVYHWSMDGQSAPKKMFDRHQNLANATIINYRTDTNAQWLLLIGLARAEDNSTKGVMQLYSVEKKVTQAIDGHAACFVDFKLSNNFVTTVVCIASSTPQGGKLFVMEVPTNKPSDAPAFERKAVPIQFPTQGDFPVAMQASDRHGVFFMITKSGFLYMYDVESATLIFSNRISDDALFITAPRAGGLIGVNKKGQVLSITVDDNTVVPYVAKVLGDQALSLKISSRANIGGNMVSDLYLQQFNQQLNQMNVQAAITLAADSPQGILRTPDTIARLQRLPVAPGQKPAISQYFQYIIEKSKLNPYESLELAKIVLQKQGGVDYLKKLLGDDKIEGSTELGDFVRQYSQELAMQIYLKGKAHDKIIDSLLQMGDYERVLAYCQKVEFTPDYYDIFRKLCMVNPDNAVKYACKIHENQQTRIEPNTVIDLLVQGNLIKQVTAYLLDILKNDRPEDGPLQTRLLEINLTYSPIQVVDSILQQKLVSHYDKAKIARMCEKAGLFQRALENYTDPNDRKRVIVNTHAMNVEWLVKWFEDIPKAEVFTYLRELMKNKNNLQIVVKVATANSDVLEPENLIPIFEEAKSNEGLYYYLGSIVGFSQDPQVHNKYIIAATKVNQLSEVERVTRESDYYEADVIKEFLKEARLANQMPLINVCDKHGYIDELVRYLYNNSQLKFIDMYVRQINPIRTPEVVGALLDVDASEDFIRNLIMGVGNMCPTEPLVEEVEKRNKLKLLLPWLEARVNEGSQEPGCHNALAKIYIDLSQNAENFLINNQFYDSRVVGQYCEKRDPHLAFVAYKRGQCDLELVAVTNKNGMFKQQARYLVERQSPELWAHVLDGENTYRRQLIDQVVQTALPESKSSDEVSTTVKAFMTANLPNELIELLEKIVLHGSSEFKTNRNLQNLLILTAISAEKTRVMDYINRLDKYDAADIARVAINKELYEEAFVMYSKNKLNTDAIRVLIDYIQSITRAAEYAKVVNEPECWSILARAQLNALLVSDAIESFMKADDPTDYHNVIQYAEQQDEYKSLIKFLEMARKKIQDSVIDTELVYSYAKYSKLKNKPEVLADMEDFISGPNLAQIQAVGDRLFDEQIYNAARILFQSISNYARLTSTLIKLGLLREAVSSAQKANSIKSWKEVMFACIDASEFRYAQSCALNIIVHADELEDLLYYYEQRGYFEQVIELMEKGLGLERAHMGIFTELGVLYAKYRPEKLMEHITRYWGKCNIPKLLQACEANHLWAEMRFLYCHHDEPDAAIKVMMEHSPEAWDHSVFTETIVKIVNMELYYRAINFYLQEQPKYLEDLMVVLTPKLDHERVARDIRYQNNGEDLPLIKKYLESVQDHDLPQVNEALNSLYIEEEDYIALRRSLDQYRNLDQLALAAQLENHELLEFRRIASWLYKLNKQWENSIKLSKKDNLYKDAMETAAESQKQDICEDLLKFFVSKGLKDCFAASLYNCYNFVRPDVALELAWRNNIIDMVMPYMVQVLREYTTKVDDLCTESRQRKKDAEIKAQQTATEYGDPNAAYTGAVTDPYATGYTQGGYTGYTADPYSQGYGGAYGGYTGGNTW